MKESLRENIKESLGKNGLILDINFTNEELVSIFEDIILSGSDEFFYPHPLDYKYTRKIGNSLDLYFIVKLKVDFEPYEFKVGYCMLRGWDKGYDIPFLGIYVHSQFRGLGLSKVIMKLLIDKAKEKGASKLGLTVLKNNEKAINLYQNMGFLLKEKSENNLIGILDLT